MTGLSYQSRSNKFKQCMSWMPSKKDNFQFYLND